MRSLSLMLLGLAISGCAASPAVPVGVSIAVPVPCAVAVPSKPTFPWDTLAGDEDIFTIVKTLLADVQARRAYELQLEVALASCVAPLR